MKIKPDSLRIIDGELHAEPIAEPIPEPVLVELGPDDVTPGSVLRYINRHPGGYHWFTIESLPDSDGVQINTGTVLNFATLKDKCEICRPDGKGFVACSKPADAKEASK